MSKQREIEKAIEYFKRDSERIANKLKHSPPFQGYIDCLEDHLKFNYLAWDALEAKSESLVVTATGLKIVK